MSNTIIHSKIGKTRKELADYVLNCTDEELYELCSIINESIKGITTWTCEECKRRFSPNCEWDDGINSCVDNFIKMDSEN